MKMRANHFVSGMTAGLIVGGVATFIAASNMSGKTRREIRQTATRAARSVGDSISSAIHG